MTKERKKRLPLLVPDDCMVEVGSIGTKQLGKCADSWTESELQLLRAMLPSQYHHVPTDWLGIRWRSLRKGDRDGTRNMKVKGHGPAKGSRSTPQWYVDYLSTADWRERKKTWLEFWGHACALCAVPASRMMLDVHHRYYGRLGHEELTDCIVLCRACHDLAHAVISVPREFTKSVFD